MTNQLKKYRDAIKRAQRKAPATWSHVGENTGIGIAIQADGSFYVYESVINEEEFEPGENGVVIPYEAVSSLYAWLAAMLDDSKKVLDKDK